MTSSNRTTRSPRTTVLVALLALVLGSLGFAGTAYGADLTAKQVKKIAAKVIKKQAPKLSVAHATTADSATTAASATNATNATTAGNATNLNGLAAAGYLDRVAQASSTTLTDVEGADQTQVLNPTAIDVPVGVTRVRVDAVVGIAPVGNALISMWIQQGASSCVGSGGDYEARQFGHSSTQDSISLTRVVTVTPGSSPSFRMCIEASVDAQVDNRNLVLETVALAG